MPGGSFEWLKPLPMLCGIGLVLGYALLGAGWLILKSEGALQDWAWKRIPWLAAAALAVVCVAFIIALATGTGLAARFTSVRGASCSPSLASWRYTLSS